MDKIEIKGLPEGELEPGKIGKTFTARCGDCYEDYTFTGGAEIGGRRRLYRATCEWLLRNVEGWKTVKGKWVCYECLRRDRDR